MHLTYNHPQAIAAFLRPLSIKRNYEGLTTLMREFLKYPYENFTKIIRNKLATTPDEKFRLPEIILDEHEEYGAGGTCFSLTYYFETILKTIGFDCYTVMVDRSYGKNTHCAIVVTLDCQKYLIDPGYCLSRPIPLSEKETRHKLPHNSYILTPRDTNIYQLSTVQQGIAKARYLLKDRPVNEEEFLSHWEASFNFPMMNHLCVTKLNEDGYTFLRDNFLRWTSSDSKKQERIIASYSSEVSRVFGISEEVVVKAREIIVE